MHNFWKDIQYAFRTLAKNPGFAVVGIVTLALGMAANTTIFSVINGLLLRSLPVTHPEQITVLALQQSGQPGAKRFSYPDYQDFRDQSGTFADLFAFRVSLVSVAADQKADHCIISRVSSNYFSTLGITPVYGRLILPTEGRTPGADPIMVLGYSYWRKRFGWGIVSGGSGGASTNAARRPALRPNKGAKSEPPKRRTANAQTNLVGSGGG
jgi:hypothetical protein